MVKIYNEQIISILSSENHVMVCISGGDIYLYDKTTGSEIASDSFKNNKNYYLWSISDNGKRFMLTSGNAEVLILKENN